MRTVIAGGHGKIALRLATLLANQGHEAVGVVRNPEHRADVEQTGASVAVLDLESATAEDLAPVVRGADAVVFAAGAGPGSSAARKDSVDRAAAELLADAAAQAGVRRYVLVSATGVTAEPDASRGEVWVAYVRAKKAAEDALLNRSDLDLTIVRPGTLTDEPGLGKVALSTGALDRVDVTRDDVAAVLAAVLEAPGTAGLTLELMGGDDDIVGAVAAVQA